MRLLLDTHVWLWMLTAPARIRADVRRLLEDEGNDLYLSAASSWEIALEHHAGKLPLPLHPRDLVESRMLRDGVRPLPVEHRHAVEVSGLPDHHRDPFDRLLIVQARLENLILVTADPRLGLYDVEILRADGRRASD